VNFNRVILGGRLTRDPELKYTQGGMAICSLGVAVDRRVKKGEVWEKEPVFVDVTIFGKRGEAFAKYHSKGSECFIEGELKLDQWEDKNGGKRSKLKVIGNEWQFVGSKKAEPAASGSYLTPDQTFGELDPAANDTPF